MANLKSCSFMSSLLIFLQLNSFFEQFVWSFVYLQLCWGICCLKSHQDESTLQISSKFLESHQRSHPPSHSVFLKKVTGDEAESITSNDYVWRTGQIRLTNAWSARKGSFPTSEVESLDDLPKKLPETNHHVKRGYSAPDNPQKSRIRAIMKAFESSSEETVIFPSTWKHFSQSRTGFERKKVLFLTFLSIKRFCAFVEELQVDVEPSRLSKRSLGNCFWTFADGDRALSFLIFSSLRSAG